MGRPEDQLTTALRNMLRKYSPWFCVVSVLLVLVTDWIAVLWYRDPTGNYEPLIGVIGAITTLLGVPSLREWRANSSSELQTGPATQLPDVTKGVPRQAAFPEQAKPWVAMRSTWRIRSDRRIKLFSVSVSTMLLMFGPILQFAVQKLVEPESTGWRILEVSREHVPWVLLASLLVSGLLPGLIMELGCARGRSLNQRIWSAIILTIVSLSILDSAVFLPFRGLLSESIVCPYGKLLFLKSRWTEAQSCHKAGAYVAAVVMMGSVIEGVLFAIGRNNRPQCYRAAHAPKTEDGKQVHLENWNLSSLIDVAVELDWIKTDRGQCSHALRQSRNVVYLWEHMATRADFDEATCRTCWHVLNAAVDDLLRAAP